MVGSLPTQRRRAEDTPGHVMRSPNAKPGKTRSATGVHLPFGATRTPLDMLVLQRTAGNAAVTTVVARQIGGQKPKESAPSSPETGGYDAISVWFPHNSTTLRQDSEVNGRALLETAAAAVRAVIAHKKDAIVVIAGYASEEGAPAHNRDLSRRRAEAVKALLVKAGIPAANLTTEGRGVTGSQPGRP